jgi:hypothetical protein
VDTVPRDLLIMNPDGSKSPIKQEEVTESKKTLSIYYSPASGSKIKQHCGLT